MYNHGGSCGFCKTEVPTDARTCTGCGADWGVNTGGRRTIPLEKFTKEMKNNIQAPFRVLIFQIICAPLFFASFIFYEKQESAVALILMLLLMLVLGISLLMLVLSSIFAIGYWWDLKTAKEQWYK